MGETPTQYKDYLRCLLWYMDMPDTKLNFAKGYTRWTKFSFGGPVILKRGINPVQITLQHSQACISADVIVLCSLLRLTSRSARLVLSYATVMGPLQALLHSNFSFLGQLFLSLVFNQLRSWTVRN